jgi:hypothetical protein
MSVASRVLQISTTASTQLVVRDSRGHKLLDLELPDGVTVAFATPLRILELSKGLSMKKVEDEIVKWLKKEGLPVTKENWLRVNFMGSLPDEIDGELEAEIPREVRAAELRAIRRADQKFLRAVGILRR